MARSIILALILLTGCEPCAIVMGGHCQDKGQENSERPQREEGPIQLVPPFRPGARGSLTRSSGGPT